MAFQMQNKTNGGEFNSNKSTFLLNTEVHNLIFKLTPRLKMERGMKEQRDDELRKREKLLNNMYQSSLALTTPHGAQLLESFRRVSGVEELAAGGNLSQAPPSDSRLMMNKTEGGGEGKNYNNNHHDVLSTMNVDRNNLMQLPPKAPPTASFSSQKGNSQTTAKSFSKTPQQGIQKNDVERNSTERSVPPSLPPFVFLPAVTPFIRTLSVQDESLLINIPSHRRLSAQEAGDHKCAFQCKVGSNYNCLRHEHQQHFHQITNNDSNVKSTKKVNPKKSTSGSWNSSVSLEPPPAVRVAIATPSVLITPQKEKPTAVRERPQTAKINLYDSSMASSSWREKAPSPQPATSAPQPMGFHQHSPKQRLSPPSTMEYGRPGFYAPSKTSAGLTFAESRVTHTDPVSAKFYVGSSSTGRSPSGGGINMGSAWDPVPTNPVVSFPKKHHPFASQKYTSQNIPLGMYSATELGVFDQKENNLHEWEAFARARLEKMNYKLRPLPHADHKPTAGFESPLEDPVRNGSMLCCLLNQIVNVNPSALPGVNSAAKKQGAIRYDDNPDVAHAKKNFVSALQVLRKLEVPNRCDAIPHSFLYLKVEDILEGRLAELWGLVDYLLRTFLFTVVMEEEPMQDEFEGGELQITEKWKPNPNVGMIGRCCQTYTLKNMQKLETVICHFLFNQSVLLEPMSNAHHATGIATALEAPYLPPSKEKCHVRTTVPNSLFKPYIFPYLCNGVMLCDILSSIVGIELLPERNPRLPSRCLHNIGLALTELRKYVPKISPLFLTDPFSIYEGDYVFILFLLEDVMRLAYDQPARKAPPSVHDVPFIPEAMSEEIWPVAVQTTAATNNTRVTGKNDKDCRGPQPAVYREEDQHLRSMYYASKLTEKQQFAPMPQAGLSGALTAASTIPTHRMASTHVLRRGESMESRQQSPQGSYGDVSPQTEEGESPPGPHRTHAPMPYQTRSHQDHHSQQQPSHKKQHVAQHIHSYTPSYVPQEAPSKLRLRSQAANTTVPSSGRSIVPSDEVQSDLSDHSLGDSNTLPESMEYLERITITSDEADQLKHWLAMKLGMHYTYSCSTFSIRKISSNDVNLQAAPCPIFSDGIVLKDLVSTLCYHKVNDFHSIQEKPKNTASKRFNVKKVIEFLKREKKIMQNYIFLEDALVAADPRAVILTIRELRTAFKNHRSGSGTGGNTSVALGASSHPGGSIAGETKGGQVSSSVKVTTAIREQQHVSAYQHQHQTVIHNPFQHQRQLVLAPVAHQQQPVGDFATPYHPTNVVPRETGLSTGRVSELTP